MSFLIYVINMIKEYLSKLSYHLQIIIAIRNKDQELQESKQSL